MLPNFQVLADQLANLAAVHDDCYSTDFIGIMSGFWSLILFTKPFAGYPNPIYFTATAMIALTGIVVRYSNTLIGFSKRIHSRVDVTLSEALIETVDSHPRYL